MEKTGCKITCGAPTTLAVKGLMMMMMMMMMVMKVPHTQKIKVSFAETPRTIEILSINSGAAQNIV